MQKEGKPAAEVVLTVLHAGGQVRRRRRLQWSRAASTASVVLGRQRAVGEPRPDGVARRLRVDPERTSAAVPQGPLEKGAKTDRRGTRITFLPDLEIFETIDYVRDTLEQRFREMAVPHEGLRIEFVDERGEGFKESFQYDGGIVDFVIYLHSKGSKDPLHKKVVYLSDSGDVGEVEVAMQWNSQFQESLLSFGQQHQHPRGWRAPLGLPLGPHAHAECVRAREGVPEGEGEEPRGR